MLKSFFNWRVLLNFLLAIGVFVGLIWLTFRWLEFHTNHGQEIPVPNVMNMTVHNAIKVLDDSGLDYEVDSFKYDPRYRPFQVLQVYPSPGSRVKGGRSIILKVNPKTWAKVSVPDVLDRYKGLAFRQLEQVGLKIGDTIYEPSIQRDAVIRLMYNGSIIKPGTLIPRFSILDIVIGAGPKRNITIPNLVGLTVKEAKAIITQNLFDVGLVEHEDGGNDESDIVYYQDPEAYDVRDQGMQIDLWASKRTPAEMSSKIEQLNSVYRIKIDTTTPPPSYYDDVPVYRAPEPVSTTPAPKPKVTESTVDVKEKTTQEKGNTNTSTSVKPTAVKVSNATSQTKPATTSKTVDKPKAKKVIVE